jgi:hypothetical protein
MTSSLSQRGLIAGSASPISSCRYTERFSSGLSGTPPSALSFLIYGPKDMTDDRAYDLATSPTTNDGALDSSSQLASGDNTRHQEDSKSDPTFPSHPGAAASPDLSFPWRLFTMLSATEMEGFDEIVSWILNGTAFKVHDQEQFVRTILPHYFKMTKYNSFTRQLYAYDFTWIRKGPERGGCT